MKERVEQFLKHYGAHLDSACLYYFGVWVESEEECNPGFSNELRNLAPQHLTSEDPLLQRSAIVALGCVGTIEDVELLEKFVHTHSQGFSVELNESIAAIRHRQKSLYDLLDEVKDMASFISFATALAKERQKAEKMEREDSRYAYGGALGWENSNIGSFIYAGLTHFDDRDPTKPLEWRDLAEFLWSGKIME